MAVPVGSAGAGSVPARSDGSEPEAGSPGLMQDVALKSAREKLAAARKAAAVQADLIFFQDNWRLTGEVWKDKVVTKVEAWAAERNVRRLRKENAQGNREDIVGKSQSERLAERYEDEANEYRDEVLGLPEDSLKRIRPENWAKAAENRAKAERLPVGSPERLLEIYWAEAAETRAKVGSLDLEDRTKAVEFTAGSLKRLKALYRTEARKNRTDAAGLPEDSPRRKELENWAMAAEIRAEAAGLPEDSPRRKELENAAKAAENYESTNNS